MNLGVKKGDRVRLLRTTDVFTKLEPGAEGIVSFVDSMNTVHVNWDSGSNLGLCYPEDRWEVIETSEQKRQRLDDEDAAYEAWCKEKGLNPAESHWDEFWAAVS